MRRLELPRRVARYRGATSQRLCQDCGAHAPTRSRCEACATRHRAKQAGRRFRAALDRVRDLEGTAKLVSLLTLGFDSRTPPAEARNAKRLARRLERRLRAEQF